jgi:MoaA/NifB/PqqE/SkfB family radical SAM enzyme
MTVADWVGVLDEAAVVDVATVQFIGGEPTLHPHLPALINHAARVGLEVEVFSNLVRVTDLLWEAFSQQGVRLACSYYTDDPNQHAAITGRSSLARTRANIAEAVRRSIPLRVGVVDTIDGQRAAEAVAELTELGVTDVGHDRLRQVGRGVRDQRPNMDQLCGHCASNVLAISPSGDVWPCVFSRWLPVGNVRRTPLAAILHGARVAEVRAALTAHFEPLVAICVPDLCDPQCGPRCGPACMPQGTRQPCAPRGGCRPNYGRQRSRS